MGQVLNFRIPRYSGAIANGVRKRFICVCRVCDQVVPSHSNGPSARLRGRPFIEAHSVNRDA
jgi:hypothetical protein